MNSAEIVRHPVVDKQVGCEAVIKTWEGYVVWAAHYYSSSNDRVTFEDRYQEGMLTLLECMQSYPSLSGDDFAKVVRRSIKNRMLDTIYARRYESLDAIEESGHPASADEALFDDVLPIVEKLCGHLSRRDSEVLKALVYPSDAIEYKSQEMAEEIKALKADGRDVRVHRKVVHKAIIEVLGISPKEFYSAIDRIRQTAQAIGLTREAIVGA